MKDLRTGAMLPDTADASDLAGVVLGQPNAFLHHGGSAHQALEHGLAACVLGDETEPVYQEKDRMFTIRVGASKDQKMLFLQSTSTDTWERGTQRRSAGRDVSSVLPREKGHKYNVEHRDGLFYIRTNRDAKNSAW